MPDRRFLQRYARRLRPRASSLDALAEALRALLKAGSSGDPFFLAHSLELLVRHLGAAQASLVMASGDTLETRWWHPECEGEDPPGPVASLCTWLQAHPERTLVARDFQTGAPFRDDPTLQALPYRAALGCALHQSGTVRGLVFVYFREPREFPRGELVLLDAVAGFIGRVLEVEELKVTLNRLENALAITQAVMEDSSTRDPETDLPNLRYLDIWEKALLGSGQRPKSLVLATCQMPVRNKRDVANLRMAAEGVRAGDLVVRMAPDRFLVVFQHTPRSLAHILLLRLRTQLGGIPMGATLWIPGNENLGIESCQGRLTAALKESRAMDSCSLVWNLPAGYQEEAQPKRRGAPPIVGPQPWQPMTLRSTSGSLRIATAGGKVESVSPAGATGKKPNSALPQDE